MADDPGIETFPVFDAADLSLVGWESGLAGDGAYVIQVRCPCGKNYAIKLPPGAYMRHDPPGTLHGEDVAFFGPLKPAAFHEPGASDR